MDKFLKFVLAGCLLAMVGMILGCEKEEPKFYMPEKLEPWRPGLEPMAAGAGGGGGRPTEKAAENEDAEGEEGTAEAGTEEAGEGEQPEKAEAEAEGDDAEGQEAAKKDDTKAAAKQFSGGHNANLGMVAARLVTPPEEAESSIDRDIAQWPMWGGAPDRNMVNPTTGLNLDFEFAGNRLIWEAQLGSQTYGNPIYSNGHVLVGTNNGAAYRDKYPAEEDKGILLCFDAKSGELLWQLTRDKMPSGRVNDWPLQGICSTPVIEGERVWVVTNRCEVMCLDLNGFHDDENDGMTDEVDADKLDADIIWSIDMYEELGVFPHNLATSSPLLNGDNLYLVTSNGVDEAHLEVPSPRAPCFLGLNKDTGEIVFEDNPPEDRILHGQWSSPCVGVVDGKKQLIFPGGDGWVYAYDGESHELLWKFDLNPKDTLWELGGAGTRNSIIGTPVFFENSVIVGVGQDPEHGEGVGHLWRIDATKTGDVSAELGEIGQQGEPNPNSAAIWHYGGTDEEDEPMFRRTMSTAAIHDGLLFISDLSGFVHCLDFETGERLWMHDLMAAVWGSPLYVDGHIMIGDEDGRLTIFDASKDYAMKRKEVDAKIADLKQKMRESDDDDAVRSMRAESKELAKSIAPEVRESESGSSIYSTPTIADGVLFISDRSRLYAIQATNQ